VSAGDGQLIATLSIVGALVLFLLEAGLAVALAAATALSRVALHRLGTENGERIAFVGGLRETASVHRIAAHLARQLCLLGGALLLVSGVGAAGWRHPVVTGIALTAVGAVLLLELGLARLIAVWDPRRALRGTAFLMRQAHWLLFPLARPLHLLLVRAGGLQNPTDEQRDEEQEEEVEALIEVGEREGLLEASESEMMRSIVDLDETAVREIMTPRPDIVALPVDADVDEARGLFLEAGHSRLPVYRESIDEVVGVLHVRDLLRAYADGEADESGEPMAQWMREAMFVPETSSVAELLSAMRLKTHIAIVVDEYGGTAGLVTLEDLVEEIVGEIREEHEPGESLIRREPDGAWIINAAAHVEKLTELFGVEFDDRDFDTVGGLVVSELGRVPTSGEVLEVRSLKIEVLEVDLRRIRLVRIRPGAPAERAQAGS
jgi:CBS domain containing-hemolysin-like protein